MKPVRDRLSMTVSLDNSPLAPLKQNMDKNWYEAIEKIEGTMLQ